MYRVFKTNLLERVARNQARFNCHVHALITDDLLMICYSKCSGMLGKYYNARKGEGKDSCWT